jgi:hypothetical protein
MPGRERVDRGYITRRHSPICRPHRGGRLGRDRSSHGIEANELALLLVPGGMIRLTQKLRHFLDIEAIGRKVAIKADEPHARLPTRRREQ